MFIKSPKYVIRLRLVEENDARPAEGGEGMGEEELSISTETQHPDDLGRVLRLYESVRNRSLSVEYSRSDVAHRL